MAITAPEVIDGAPRTPFQFGLFSVSNLRSGDGHWQTGGVEWEALSCDPASGLAAPDCEGPQLGIPKNFDEGVPLGEAQPFAVYGTYKCSPIGHSLEFAREQSVLQLQVKEEARAEQAFWTGDLENSPTLVDGAVTLGGGIVSPEIALALLEDWIANNYGSVGVIHATRGVALVLIAAKLLEVKNGVLQTRLGTPVVAGAGYPGTSPAGAAPGAGTGWAYASPAVFGRRSDIYDSTERRGDLLDRAENDLYAIAERMYLFGFDPCGTAAVNFNLE